MTKPWPFPSQMPSNTTASELACFANTPATEQAASKLASQATTSDLFPAPLMSLLESARFNSSGQKKASE